MRKKFYLQKKLLISNPNRGVYSDVFNLFKDEIKELIDFGLKYKSILSLLEKELDCSLNYKTFISWVNKNIKQKNQSSNNTLRKNTKKQKVELKKEETKRVKENNENVKNKDEEVDDEDWKSVIFPQIEVACEGMRKANLRI